MIIYIYIGRKTTILSKIKEKDGNEREPKCKQYFFHYLEKIR